MSKKYSALTKFTTALALAMCLVSANSIAQTPTAGIGVPAPNARLNPLLPDYFADPTIKKFGDIYYIYATTDNIMLASGAPTVWYSKDFVNWYNYTMEVPSFTKVMRLANSYNALFFNSTPFGAAAHLDYHFGMPFKHLPAANQWHHLVLTFDGMVEKIYVDGVVDNLQMMTVPSAIKNAKFIIGASDAGEYYTCYLASLKMYDYALSQAKVQQQLQKTNSVNNNTQPK